MADDRPQCRQYREPFRGEAGVLFGKAGGRADTRTRLYTRKGLPPPVLGSLSFFSSEPKRSPGASGPRVVWTSIQEIPYPPIFIKRKSADHLGCLGGYPLSVSLRPFSTRRKDVVAHLISFSAKSRSFCADIPISRFSRFGLRATFFLHTKKEGKDVPRGAPPWSPGWFCRFSLYENRLGRRPQLPPI